MYLFELIIICPLFAWSISCSNIIEKLLLIHLSVRKEIFFRIKKNRVKKKTSTIIKYENILVALFQALIG